MLCDTSPFFVMSDANFNFASLSEFPLFELCVIALSFFGRGKVVEKE